MGRASDDHDHPYRAEEGPPEYREGRQLDDNTDDLGRNVTDPEKTEEMVETAIYRLTPIAQPDDTNWDRTVNRGDVIVRARSSGDARVVASEGEAEAMGKNPTLATTQLLASAFRDSHLYAVRRVSDSQHPALGPREVLEADFLSKKR
ncbi:hypothetical protein [Devosia nitrariae]|uniref:Uncharacterized protein n=1 Tax=Devosia nitrariae TaxID=2071872 RepID=A0ABQ5W6U1_9HYPH|nr:hypothetical protein [Devosia nitrariae]GLQ55511.1 hypothetical protein GCM10010862_27700 [Devosia nitrariae]